MRIEFALRDLEKFGLDLTKLSPEELGATMVVELNRVGKDAYELSQKAILRGVNLREGYVRRKMDTRPATKTNPVFEIVAARKKGFETGLGHYGAMPLTKRVRWPDPIEGMGIGPYPLHQYTPRKSDEKPDGASVEVVRGARKTRPDAFMIPGKVDTEGNPTLFVGRGGRSGSKKETTDRQGRKVGRQKIRRLLGPAVYQLFRTTIPLVRDEIEENLQAAIVRAAEEYFDEAFE